MFTAFIVLTRIIANPLSNVFQKKLAQGGASPIFIITATHAILTVAMLPLLAAHLPLELGMGFWTNMILCAVLAVCGNVLLVYALRATDLSILGPINTYKAVLSLALGIFLLGEVPTVWGAAGVILILAGSNFVVDRTPGQTIRHALAHFFLDRGIQLRLAALAFSATEAIFLKRAILEASPMITFIMWTMLGLPVAATAVAFMPTGANRVDLRNVAQHWQTYLWLAFTTGIMQTATLFTFGKLQVGYSLALFQLSSLFSVFLGYRYFAERNIGRRLVGSAIMMLGAILIVLLGQPT